MDKSEGGREGERGEIPGGTSTCLRVYNRRDVEWLYSSGVSVVGIVGWRVVEGGGRQGRDGIVRGERERRLEVARRPLFCDAARTLPDRNAASSGHTGSYILFSTDTHGAEITRSY